jgi:hypothetical protein
MKTIGSILLVLLCAVAGRAQQIAVLPMADASIEDFGEQFTIHSTLILREKIQERAWASTFLNPGGVYTPSDTDLVTSFAQEQDPSSRPGTALVTTLLQIDRPRRGPWKLRVRAELTNIATSQTVELGTFDHKVRPDELVVEMAHGHFWGGTGSRPFEKQPIGHLAEDVADQISEAAIAQAQRWQQNRVPPLVTNIANSACDSSFQVSYGNHKISRIYDLLLDNKFESVTTEDGRLSLPMFPGPHVLLLHLNDVPYKVPAQKQYAIDFAFDCARPALSVEIGPGGEAVLNTHP